MNVINKILNIFKHDNLSKYGLPILAVCMLIFTARQLFHTTSKPKEAFTFPAVQTEFKKRVAGIGMIEPKSEFIKIVPHIPGIIQDVYVTVGQKVKQGNILFTIDSATTKAQISTSKAKLVSAKLAVEYAKYELKLYDNIIDTDAISKKELAHKKFQVKHAESALKEAEFILAELKTKLSKLSLRAPINGEILRINARIGEYASTEILPEALITLGDTSVLHVRVEVDEIDAQRVLPNKQAIGALRGKGDITIPLTLVRIEPMLQPKRSLTGDSNIRIDTRVLEVIYSFDNKKLQAYLGQLMDVYIEAEE